MAITSLIIKRISGGDYLIDDLGIVVPNADQTEITDLHDIRDALCSAKLHAAALASDLVLNDGARDIPVAEVSCFMRRYNTGHLDEVPTFAGLPSPGVARQVYIVADEHITYMWNGEYWGHNGIFCKEVKVGIGAAAADHDVGWDVPAGAAVISRAIKLLKLLTGSGGCTGIGFGTGAAGDPDKYGETTTLTADSHDEGLHGTFNDGGGDDLKITATDGGGSATGTVAGSGTEDVLVRIKFRLEPALA